MFRTAGFTTVGLLAFACSAFGQQYKAAKLDTPAPTGAVAPEITSLLQPTGFQVTKGASQVIEMWLAKEWPIAADAKTGGDILYPLTPGQLIGVARYPGKAADFRDQDIPAGVYILRYAQQPVDGAHVGTSPTRDFLALLPAAKDRDPKTMDYKTLIGISKETSGTAHPGILSLQRAADSDDALFIREDADKEWTIVRFVGKTKQGSEVKNLALELVVVGKAAE